MKKIIYSIILILLLQVVLAEEACTEDYCNDVIIGKPSMTGETENYTNTIAMNPITDSSKKGHLYNEIRAIILASNGGGKYSRTYTL